jgi:hypothetical protein
MFCTSCDKNNYVYLLYANTFQQYFLQEKFEEKGYSEVVNQAKTENTMNS